MNSAEQMSADPEEILYDAVHRCEALQMGGRLEPAHVALALADRPSVVEPERSPPLPNRLMRHGDTLFHKEILDISDTQAETVVEPDGLTDDVRDDIGIRDSWAAGSSSTYSATCGLNLTMPSKRLTS